MTSPYVTFSQPPAPRSSAWPVLRAILSVLVVLAGIAGFVIAGFIAVIVWTGCFLSCTGENHPGGAALGLLAVVFLAAGPGLVALMYRSRAWLNVAYAAAAIGSVLLTLALSSN
jgi:hypothetical protein